MNSERIETVQSEIRREIDNGANASVLFTRLNRILQGEYRGGAITHVELRHLMTYAVDYLKRNSGRCD